MKYCKNCNQNVQPTKKFSIGWFLVNCVWVLGGPVYLLYFVFGKKKSCPICHSTNFEHSRSGTTIKSTSNVIIDKDAKYNALVAKMKAERKLNKTT